MPFYSITNNLKSSALHFSIGIYLYYEFGSFLIRPAYLSCGGNRVGYAFLPFSFLLSDFSFRSYVFRACMKPAESAVCLLLAFASYLIAISVILNG